MSCMLYRVTTLMCRNSYGRYRPGTIYLIRQVEGMFPWIVVIREISRYMMYRHISYPCISEYHISHLIRCISRPRYHVLILLVCRLDLCRCYKAHRYTYENQYICRIKVKTKIWHIYHLFLSCIYYLFRLHYPILYATSRQHIWTILHANFIFMLFPQKFIYSLLHLIIFIARFLQPVFSILAISPISGYHLSGYLVN